jgi:hypothetical protein
MLWPSNTVGTPDLLFLGRHQSGTALIPILSILVKPPPSYTKVKYLINMSHVYVPRWRYHRTGSLCSKDKTIYKWYPANICVGTNILLLYKLGLEAEVTVSIYDQSLWLFHMYLVSCSHVQSLFNSSIPFEGRGGFADIKQLAVPLKALIDSFWLPNHIDRRYWVFSS